MGGAGAPYPDTDQKRNETNNPDQHHVQAPSELLSTVLQTPTQPESRRTRERADRPSWESRLIPLSSIRHLRLARSRSRTRPGAASLPLAASKPTLAAPRWLKLTLAPSFL